MRRSGNIAEYQALAQFRFLIRRYLNNSEKAARSVGLEPQQYMGLLALRGLPEGEEPTLRYEGCGTQQGGRMPAGSRRYEKPHRCALVAPLDTKGAAPRNAKRGCWAKAQRYVNCNIEP